MSMTEERMRQMEREIAAEQGLDTVTSGEVSALIAEVRRLRALSMNEERRVLILTIRALLSRDVRDSQGHHDYDTEAVLNEAKLLGVDVEAEEQRAIDARTIPSSEFNRKWRTP